MIDAERDVEPQDLDDETIEESTCQCDEDFCLSRLSIKKYFLLREKYNTERRCLCDGYDIAVHVCCCNRLGLSCHGKCHADGYDRWLDSREPINP